MFSFFIDPEIKEKCLQLAIGWFAYRTKVTLSSTDLWYEIGQTCTEIQKQYLLTQLTDLTEIADGRKFYKRCGKDPSRYRISSESLLRRILQGKGLYPVNNIVDINNLISIRYRLPVCSYDWEHLSGDLVFRIGRSGETFKGIRKEIINLEGLPVFTDNIGPFGSPTHDSERTMITDNSRHIMTKIISFSGRAPLESAMNGCRFLLEKYIETEIIHAQIIHANGK